MCTQLTSDAGACLRPPSAVALHRATLLSIHDRHNGNAHKLSSTLIVAAAHFVPHLTGRGRQCV